LKGQAVQYHTNKAQTADGAFAKQSKEKHYDAADKALKKASNRDTGIGRAADRLAKEEVEMIDEAVKVGAMKLHDGSTMNVTRAMADTLNGVFEQLNPMNRIKMEQKLHSSKKDFEEILAFAKGVN
jgi:hypothetical protein